MDLHVAAVTITMSIYQCDYELADKLKPGLNPLRIIIAAMAAGAAAFLTIAVALRISGNFGSMTPTMSLLRWAAIGLAPIAFVASRALVASQLKFSRQQLVAGTSEPSQDADGAHASAFLADLGDAGKLFAVYTTQAIISTACLEFAALACIVSFMFTGSLASLALSVALICAIVPNIPLAASSVAEWIEEQLRLVEEERMRIR
ncbi:MAG TPA: hypothetical protein VHV55_08160 [Pirellulales bacterium]|jgi:hypothetical protein|nr:hypothetical protein [Pirellulales bacterium]